ncbi:unnamed protein product [Aphanomyces euteiches]|uniref:Uncharacterized protein n=1 Tax=Aphanomyces euteiches TaxID=100861 RepID=A0A6G0WFN5_9STRA|nr:hypothetical protein Ae201684_016297 [Aphanomyces euteiches]KAH9079870.1 hypothetical protein Ae201684P_007579 [Aphanomyces euteiches]KAH9154255.1 hypothetical protein AeRB84_003620 [Aphanomyces euteiches]
MVQSGYSPLHEASYSGHFLVVEELVAHGAVPNLAGEVLVHGAVLCFGLLLSAFVLRTPPPNYVVGGRNPHGIKVTDPPKQSLTSHIGLSTDSAERVSAVLGDIQQDNYVSVFDYREQELGEAEILYHNKIKNLCIRECAFSVDFAFLYLVFMAACAPGTILLSRVYSIGGDVYIDDTAHKRPQQQQHGTVSGHRVVPRSTGCG